MPKYPGTKEAEAEKEKVLARKREEMKYEEAPDFIAGAPNYEKYAGWTPERVMAWLNID